MFRKALDCDTLCNSLFYVDVYAFLVAAIVKMPASATPHHCWCEQG